MHKRLTKVLQASALAGLAVACVLFISCKTGHGIPCPFYLITHLQCPGCGGWRMLMSLLRLDFKAAFAYNAALLVSLPILAVIIIRVTVQYIKTGSAALKRYENTICVALIVVLIAFGILRNVF